MDNDTENLKLSHQISWKTTDDEMLFFQQIGLRWAQMHWGTEPPDRDEITAADTTPIIPRESNSGNREEMKILRSIATLFGSWVSLVFRSQSTIFILEILTVPVESSEEGTLQGYSTWTISEQR